MNARNTKHKIGMGYVQSLTRLDLQEKPINLGIKAANMLAKFLAGKINVNCESNEYFGAFETTTSQRLSIQCVGVLGDPKLGELGGRELHQSKESLPTTSQ